MTRREGRQEVHRTRVSMAHELGGGSSPSAARAPPPPAARLSGGSMAQAGGVGGRWGQEQLSQTAGGGGGGSGRHLCESDDDSDDGGDAYAARARSRHALTSTWSHHSAAPGYGSSGSARHLQASSASNVSVSIGKSGVLSRQVASATGGAGGWRGEAAAGPGLRTAGSAAGYYSQAEDQASGPVRHGQAGRDGRLGARGSATSAHANLRLQNWTASAGYDVAGHASSAGCGAQGLLTSSMRARAAMLGDGSGDEADDDGGGGKAQLPQSRGAGHATGRGLFPPI